MTIPTLVARINDKVAENQNKVFQAKYCEKNGAKLPNAEQLAKITRTLYNDTSIPATVSYIDNLDWSANKTVVFDALGIDFNSTGFTLWSAEPDASDTAYDRTFIYDVSGYQGAGCRSSNTEVDYAICVK